MQMKNTTMLICLICWSSDSRVEAQGFVKAVKLIYRQTRKVKKKMCIGYLCMSVCAQKAKHFSSQKEYQTVITLFLKH